MLRKKIILLLTLSLILFLTGCDNNFLPTNSNDDSSANTTDVDETIAEVLDDNAGIHEDEADYTWDSSTEINVILSDTGITVDASVATIDGSIITITSAGNYNITGTLSDGQVYVNTDDSDPVRLILNGIDISCSTNAPLYIIKAEKTIIVIADGTENYVSDGSTYVNEDDANAAIYCKDDLTICGNGTLNVTGNYNDGITGKDGCIIKSGTFNVTAVDDGIRGKDYLIIEDGNFTVNSGGDAIKSDNEDDTDKGYIAIENGIFNITAGGDGITGETDVVITGGDFTIKTAGGSSASISDDLSAKGIKAAVNLVIDGGNYSINAADDGLHSNYSMVINGGTYKISTGDDGLHTDSYLVVNDGDITVSKSYEGIESVILTINGGTLHLTSSDDGINAAGEYSNYLYINGGYMVVNASGDGIDVNGSITMTGGTILVNGPTNDGNGSIDYDYSFKISGGLLIAAGSAGMAQAPGSTSTQYSVLITFRSTLAANTLFNVQSSDGTEIFTFTPIKRYGSVAFSLPELAKGTTYNVYYGGSSTGTKTDGLYDGGTYSPGTKLTSFTISNTVTKVSIR